MPVTPADRPLDSLRDDTVDRLIMNYGHGRLSLEAFQRRLDEAFDATDHATLSRLVEDLELEVDANYVAGKREAVRAGYDADEAGEVETLIAIFGGSDRTGRWQVPGEVRCVAIFGGCDIDLTEATFTAPVTRIRLLCLFGGVDIYVPEGVNTTVKSFAIFGGVDNHTPSATDPDAPRLVVEGLVMFGGADVKLRRSLKQRMLDLADRIRSSLQGGTR
ncbi:MAG: LiaF-related protein [Pseudomonadales bacterium]